MLKANLAISIALLCLVLIITLYLKPFLKKQKDESLIPPVFNPPKDLLPADCAYFYLKDTDINLVLTITLIDMAIKKYISIEYAGKIFFSSTIIDAFLGKRSKTECFIRRDSYTLKKEDRPENIIKIYHKIRIATGDQLLLSQKKYDIIQKIKSILKKNSYKYSEFISLSYHTPILCTMITIICTSTIIYLGEPASMVFLMLLGVPINIIGTMALRDYTEQGKFIYYEVAGFRNYLLNASKHHLNNTRLPTMNIELFEKYLSYAIALGVSKEWTKEFYEIFDEMEEYKPYWYSKRKLYIHDIHYSINLLKKKLSKSIYFSSQEMGFLDKKILRIYEEKNYL